MKHAWDFWLLLAESHLTGRLFGSMLQRIWALPVPANSMNDTESLALWYLRF